jgi:hypothetical protein
VAGVPSGSNEIWVAGHPTGASPYVDNETAVLAKNPPTCSCERPAGVFEHGERRCLMCGRPVRGGRQLSGTVAR